MYCFICFLFYCLLIYIYELFIDICLYFMLSEIKNLFCLLVFSTHAVMHFVLVFHEIYRLIQLSCYLHLQLMDSSYDWICFYEHFFCKGLFFVNFELLVVFCHGLPKGEFVWF